MNEIKLALVCLGILLFLIAFCWAIGSWLKRESARYRPEWIEDRQWWEVQRLRNKRGK